MSLPINRVINITDRVIANNSKTRVLAGLLLTSSDKLKSVIQSFTDLDSVVAAFGAASIEAKAAGLYFNGYSNSKIKPSKIWFGQFTATTSDEALEQMQETWTTNSTWAGFTNLDDLDDDITLALCTFASTKQRVYVPHTIDVKCFDVLDTTNIVYKINKLNLGYVSPQFGGYDLSVCVLAMGASINYSNTNSRINFAFKSFTGVASTITTSMQADALDALRCNYYADFEDLAENIYYFYQKGFMTGEWLWIDNYYNNCWLDGALTSSIANVMKNASYVPFSPSGYSMLNAAMITVMNLAIINAVVEAGVTIDESTANILYQDAGQDIAPLLTQQGYFIQINDPDAATKAERGSPIINVWYINGGCVNKVTITNTQVIS